MADPMTIAAFFLAAFAFIRSWKLEYRVRKLERAALTDPGAEGK
jgi:hypothetical protein